MAEDEELIDYVEDEEVAGGDDAQKDTKKYVNNYTCNRTDEGRG